MTAPSTDDIDRAAAMGEQLRAVLATREGARSPLPAPLPALLLAERIWPAAPAIRHAVTSEAQRALAPLLAPAEALVALRAASLPAGTGGWHAADGMTALARRALASEPPAAVWEAMDHLGAMTRGIVAARSLDLVPESSRAALLARAHRDVCCGKTSNGAAAALFLLARFAEGRLREAILAGAMGALEEGEDDLDGALLGHFAAAGPPDVAIARALSRPRGFGRAQALAAILAHVPHAERPRLLDEWLDSVREATEREAWPTRLALPIVGAEFAPRLFDFVCSFARGRGRAVALAHLAVRHPSVALAAAVAEIDALPDPHRWLGRLSLMPVLSSELCAGALPAILAALEARSAAHHDGVRFADPWPSDREPPVDVVEHDLCARDLYVAAHAWLDPPARRAALLGLLRRFDAPIDASPRVRAALAISEGLSDAARARVLATADHAIEALPITDAARVHRAVAAPSEASLRAAMETLCVPDTSTLDIAALAPLLGDLCPLLGDEARRALLRRWLDEAFSGAPHTLPAEILDAITPHLPADLFGEALARARGAGDHELHLFAKLAVRDPHPSRPALLEECLDRCLRERRPWCFDAIDLLLPQWNADQLLRVAGAFRRAARANPRSLWSRKRGLPQLSALIGELSRRGRGDDAIALLELLPDRSDDYRMHEHAVLLPHFPEPERSQRAREVLDHARSPETYPNVRASLLAAMAPHADALGLAAAVLDAAVSLPEQRGWVLHALASPHLAEGPSNPAVAALVRHELDEPLGLCPAVAHLLPVDHLVRSWDDWLRRSAGERSYWFYQRLIALRPMMIAIAGDAGVEAIAAALLGGGTWA